MQIDPKKIYPEEFSSVFRSAQKADIFSAEQHESAIFFNLEKIHNRIKDLQQAFPTNSLHAIAIKTNPLLQILTYLNQFDTGLEAASFPEVELALHAGFSPESIIFDSPAKTEKELRQAIQRGIHINIDNFTEAERIHNILKQTTSDSSFGIRVNPQTGVGKIASMSTAGKYSKFGIPLTQYRERIMMLFHNYPWLSGLHVHSGSQGLEIEQMIQGVEKIYQLAEEINSNQSGYETSPPVQVIDIGGGFPISYHSEIPSPEISKYASELKRRCPKLFTDYKLMTEFGRFIYGHSGWVVSRAEYIKHQQYYTTAIIHVGADLFLRESYNPEDWHHDISVLDEEGHLKTDSEKHSYHIGGPLCFEGDMLVKNRDLPLIEEGDYIIIQDTGANTINLWSRHCSRLIPKIIGYYEQSGEFITIKENESFEDILRFWS